PGGRGERRVRIGLSPNTKRSIVERDGAESTWIWSKTRLTTSRGIRPALSHFDRRQAGWSSPENHTAPSPSPTSLLVRGGERFHAPPDRGGAGRDTVADGVVSWVETHATAALRATLRKYVARARPDAVSRNAC